MTFALQGRLGLDARDFIKGTRTAADGLEDIEDGFGKLPAAAKEGTKGATSEIGKLPAETEKIGKTSGSGLGAGLIKGFGAAGVAAFIGKSLQKSFEIDGARAKMKAQFGLIEADAKRFGDAAGDVYADGWGDSFKQVSHTVALVGKSLQDVGDIADDELAKISTGALNIADVFGEDVDSVIRSTGQLLRNGLAPDAEAALDLITAGFQQGGNRAGDLLDVIDEYSQHFALMGISGEEAMTLIVNGMQAGQRDADKLADAIKEFGIRASDGSASTVAAFEAIGLSADGMRAKFIAGGDTARAAYDEVIAALDTVDDQVRQDAAIALFGTQFEDLGRTALPILASMTDGMENVEGATDDLTEALKTNETEWIKFQRNIEMGMAKVGTAVATAGNAIIDGADDWFSTVHDMGEAFGGLIGTSNDVRTVFMDDIEAATGQFETFDRALLDGLSTFAEVREAVMDQTGNYHLANEIALEWSETTGANIQAQRDMANATLVADHALRDQAMAARGGAVEIDKSTKALGRHDEAARKSSKAIQRLDSAWGRLKGQLSQRAELLDIKDEFDRVEEAAEEAWNAAAEGSEDAAAKVRDHEQDLIGLKLRVGEYGREVLHLPDSVVTKMIADIDAGAAAEVEALLERLSRPRTVAIRARRVGSTGGGNTFFADGGRTPGGPVVVGEEGPELVDLPRGSFVHTAAQTAAMASRVTNITNTASGGGRAINLTVNAGVGADGFAIGQQVVEWIGTFERTNGPGWRAA